MKIVMVGKALFRHDHVQNGGLVTGWGGPQ